MQYQDDFEYVEFHDEDYDDDDDLTFSGLDRNTLFCKKQSQGSKLKSMIMSSFCFGKLVKLPENASNLLNKITVFYLIWLTFGIFILPQ